MPRLPAPSRYVVYLLAILMLGVGCGSSAVTRPPQTQATALGELPPTPSERVTPPLPSLPLAVRSRRLLRVMTFNLRHGPRDEGQRAWSERRQRAVRTILEFAPDVLGLQEVETARLDELADALPDYGVLGVGSEDGADGGVANGLAYRQDRFELLESGVFWLSDTPGIAGSATWGNRQPRSVSWAVLRNRGSGLGVLVYNTHLDHASASARAQSLALIARDVHLRRGDLPVVVMGDFNLYEDSAPYVEMLASAGLQDTYRTMHPVPSAEEATYHAFEGTRTGRRIDFVLSREAEVVSSEIVRSDPGAPVASDHFPVTATLRLASH